MSLDEEITVLKAEIAGYKFKLDNPSTIIPPETYERLSEMFTIRSAYLTELVKQKNATTQQQAGKLIPNTQNEGLLTHFSVLFFSSLYIISAAVTSNPLLLRLY